jgi:hypothetical protein
VLLIDPDQANGNGRRVNGLVGVYTALQERLGNKLGNDRDGQSPLRLFSTGLDLLGPGLQVWRPSGLRNTLKQSIDYERLAGGYGIYQDVVRMLFTPTSLDMEMRVGFRGRPAIGAAAMSLVSRAESEPLWKRIVAELERDAVTGPARVFVAGSVFGGTGASVFHPIVRFLRSNVKLDRKQLRIGVGSLVPYFTFVDAEDNTTAKSKYFPLATRSAVEFYQHLRENQDWEFDAMFWAGDNDPMKVKTSEGGDLQENPAHFCELLMAVAAVDFFSNDIAGGVCHYAGPRQPPDVPAVAEDRNPADWVDLPRLGPERDDLQREMMRMFVMAMAHRGFWEPLLTAEGIDQRPECVPWYLERFRGDGSLRAGDAKGLEAFGAYVKDHFLRWWSEILASDRASFFNRAVLTPDGRGVDVTAMPNIRLPNNPTTRARDFDEFFDAMVGLGRSAGGERGLARYVALLAHAADEYVEEYYRADLRPSPDRA